MTISYGYDESAALQQGGGGITESGFYVGKFVSAKHIEAKTGSIGVEFELETTDGRRARYLTIYTVNSDGDVIEIGKNLLNALMFVLGVDGAKGEQTQFDRDGNQVVTFPSLLGRVGVVLQRENYIKENGSSGYRMSIVLFADPDTRQTPQESLQESDPSHVEAIVANFKASSDHGSGANNPAKNAEVVDVFSKASNKKRGSNSNAGDIFSNSKPERSRDFDDDIPF